MSIAITDDDCDRFVSALGESVAAIERCGEAPSA